MEGWRQWRRAQRSCGVDFAARNRSGAPFSPRAMLAERSSPSRVRFAAQSAPLTAPGRSAQKPLGRKRKNRGGTTQIVLDFDRPSHGRPYRSEPVDYECNGDFSPSENVDLISDGRQTGVDCAGSVLRTPLGLIRIARLASEPSIAERGLTWHCHRISYCR